MKTQPKTPDPSESLLPTSRTPSDSGFVSRRRDGRSLADTVLHLNYKADEVRSALNKCIRRGREREACWWGFQLIRHGWVRYLHKTLRVIAVEDVGVASPEALVMVDSILNHGEKGTVLAALKAMNHLRSGRVVCGVDGAPVAEAALKHGVYRVCRRAGLPPRSWHTLRHTFATNCARLGTNPWTLQTWLGHSDINQTLRYVHHAKAHQRPLPEGVLRVGGETADPDSRVTRQLAELSSSGGPTV